MNIYNKDIGARNGDIWMMVRMGGECGSSAIRGSRPCVVIQNQIACIRSTNLTVIPITSKPMSQPTHTQIPANDETGLIHDSISQAESITTISQNMVSYKLGFLNESIMRNVENSLLLHLGVLKPLNKAHISNLCDQICGDLIFVENETFIDRKKLIINSIKVHLVGLKFYSKIYRVDYVKILANNLKRYEIELSINEIESIYKVSDI